MIFSILLITLFLSFMAHIAALVSYVIRRSERSLKHFINTTLSNVLIAGTCIVIALAKPHLIQRVDTLFISWLMSGIVMLVTFFAKVRIFWAIYKRSKEPENFHYNFFGKKVLHSTVVSRIEIAVFFGTIPFFLLSGSYFVARLINFFLYKHI